MRAGIIGCGNISDTYIRYLSHAENIELAAVADQIDQRALAKAQQHDMNALPVSSLLEDETIDLIINLTIPAAHAAVSTAALEAGKHVFSEKPLALTVDEGRRLLELSQERGLSLGSAPDTVLGAGMQTARKIIDDGWIGDPVAAGAFVTGPGHERWHPDPDFFYQPGGGPLFDMGPYYLSALFQLLGPIQRVSSIANQSFAQRIIQSEPRRGERITVRTPTHIAGSLQFAGGAVATLITSFDVWHTHLPHIEIYGSEGTLSVPDPNSFGGQVKLRRWDADEWSSVPLISGPTVNSRGLGAVELVQAVAAGRIPRADGTIALHVLEVMEGLLKASQEGSHQEIESRPLRPLPMPWHPEILPRR